MKVRDSLCVDDSVWADDSGLGFGQLVDGGEIWRFPRAIARTVPLSIESSSLTHTLVAVGWGSAGLGVRVAELECILAKTYRMAGSSFADARLPGTPCPR